MTNEEAKQEAIKKAYGDLWPIVEEFTYVDSARCHTSFYKPDQTIFDFRELPKEQKKGFIFYGQNGHVLPKSIEGIENNNGWIRIEPDGSNLPTDGKFYKVFAKEYSVGRICDDPVRYDKEFGFWRFKSGFMIDATVTHYKPITPELPPVY